MARMTQPSLLDPVGSPRTDPNDGPPAGSPAPTDPPPLDGAARLSPPPGLALGDLPWPRLVLAAAMLLGLSVGLGFLLGWLEGGTSPTASNHVDPSPMASSEPAPCAYLTGEAILGRLAGGATATPIFHRAAPLLAGDRVTVADGASVTLVLTEGSGLSWAGAGELVVTPGLVGIPEGTGRIEAFSAARPLAVRLPTVLLTPGEARFDVSVEETESIVHVHTGRVAWRDLAASETGVLTAPDGLAFSLDGRAPLPASSSPTAD